MNEARDLEFVRDVCQANTARLSFDDCQVPEGFLNSTSSHPKLEEAGRRLLRERKVAVLTPAGGLSTRLGNVFRADVPVGPVTTRSLLQLQGEKVAAVRKKFDVAMPWLVMTSEPVHDQTEALFETHDYFEIPRDQIWFFQQPTYPVLDAELGWAERDGVLMRSPNGHGGVLEALGESKLLERLCCEGIESLFYFQYPNVLERVCDPVMLGYHQENGFETTTKGFHHYDPTESLGRIVWTQGSLRVVEYFLIQESETGPLRNRMPANTGTHVFSVSFLQRILEQGNPLPYHCVQLHGDRSLRKIERFVFDLLPHSKNNGLVIVPRADEYACVKRETGVDSLEAARDALLNQYRGWLERAGAVPENPNCRVEVSPHFALGVEDVIQKVRCGFQYPNDFVFQ